jgi:SAM-dependent methyltransferase
MLRSLEPHNEHRDARRWWRGLWLVGACLLAVAVLLVFVEMSTRTARGIAVGSVAALSILFLAGGAYGASLQSRYMRELVSTASTLASRSDDDRLGQWATTAVLDALDLRPGLSVAEIGAGGGFFVKVLAERVGPTGYVLATDVSPAMVGRLIAMAERSGLRHIEPSVVSSDTPLAARRLLDRILIANVYCFTRRREKQARTWFSSWASMLGAGGKLVIFHEFVHSAGWRADRAFPPLEDDQPTGEELAAWAREYFAVESLQSTPEPPRPYQPHEAAGYVLVLRKGPARSA